MKSWGEQLLYVNSKTGNRNWKISLRKKLNNKCDSLKGACKWCYWYIWPFFSFSYLSPDNLLHRKKCWHSLKVATSQNIFSISPNLCKTYCSKIVLCKQFFLFSFEDFWNCDEIEKAHWDLPPFSSRNPKLKKINNMT